MRLLYWEMRLKVIKGFPFFRRQITDANVNDKWSCVSMLAHLSKKEEACCYVRSSGRHL
jgi:hypothetical protein